MAVMVPFNSGLMICMRSEFVWPWMKGSWGNVFFMSEYLKGQANHSILTRGERYLIHNKHIGMEFRDTLQQRRYRGYSRDKGKKSGPDGLLYLTMKGM